MTASPSPADLSLAAIRYLTDEMTAAESAEFERLLESDAAAQQALVQAVQLAAALPTESTVRASAPPPRVAVQPLYGSRHWTTALAMAGCGIVAATLLVALRHVVTPVALTGQQSGAAGTVSAWTELSVEEELARTDESMFVTDDDRPTADVIPDWLLAAVEVDQAYSTGGNGTSGDRAEPLDDEI